MKLVFTHLDSKDYKTKWENNTMTLLRISTGLELGTNFLTNHLAYFLGLLTAEETLEIDNELYWVAPVRHNPKYYTISELEQHYNNVKSLARSIHHHDLTIMAESFKRSGNPIRKFNVGKNGFATIFKQIQSDYSTINFIQDISEILLSSPQLIRCFLVGTFDGRSSFDSNTKFISIDFELGPVKEFVERCLTELNINFNSNSQITARQRENTNSQPRKPQLRVNRDVFITEIGYISIIRLGNAISNLQEGSFRQIEDNEVLPGLKTIQLV